MTPRQDSLYPDDWLRVARLDWHRIFVMLQDGDAEGAGFFLQQALEKYLKAYLLAKGWKLKKVHTLPSLLDEAAEHSGALVQFRELCERVSGFYLSERYPAVESASLELHDVQKEIPEAHSLIESLFQDEHLEEG